MAANVGKANRVQSSVDDMINSLAELYQTNAYWKNKYLQDRKAHFQQFMAPFQILRAQVFSEWKDYTFEHASDMKISSMEEDIAKLHSDGEALLNERESDFRKKLEQMERLATTVADPNVRRITAPDAEPSAQETRRRPQCAPTNATAGSS